jgi:hypothetical protein
LQTQHKVEFRHRKDVVTTMEIENLVTMKVVTTTKVESTNATN